MGESHYEVYFTRNVFGRKRWRWRYVASNGEIVASGQGYSRKIDCEHAIAIMQDSHTAPVRYLA